MNKLSNAHQQLAFDCTKHVRAHYKLNDEAHKIDHAHQVMQDGVRIAKLISAEHLIPKIIVAAYYHDIHRVNPDSHHIMAYEQVFIDHDFIYSSGGADNWQDLREIALACMEHRSSWNGEYSGLLSEVIASADRGDPSRITVNDKLRRSYMYARGSLSLGHLAAMQHSLRHIKDRFGTGGNSRYPQIYKTVYAVELDRQVKEIDNLEMGDVKWQVFMAEWNSDEVKNDLLVN